MLALTAIVVGAAAQPSTQAPAAPPPPTQGPARVAPPARPARPAPAALTARAEPGRFTTLPNFAVERVVPASKTDSYVTLTFDSQGRLVVSKETDAPRRLVDADGDGIYEGEVVVSTAVEDCQGLWYDGPTLYGACAPAGSGQRAAASAPGGPGWPQAGPARSTESGLYRMTDSDGDGVTDDVSLIAGFIDGIQEHGVHALRRGPDGALTLMVGNNTFLLDDSQVEAASPFRGDRESQFLPVIQDGRNFGPSARQGAHGTLMRVDPERRRFTIVAGALRNAYDHAFNLDGELFTFDSDMEWDIGMPWYRDIRTIHLVPGGDYGYRNGAGKLQPWALDTLPAVRDVGRGSPVGVEFYQARAYPSAFRDVLLEADWSRGRLLYTPLTQRGATYVAGAARTELVHGEPLNITDVEVGPDGLVYFTTGGRFTEGGVYRVRYTGPAPATAKLTPILAAVRQAQPLSSWGYAAIEKTKADLGDGWASGLDRLVRDRAAAGSDRAQAVYILQRHGPAPSVALLTELARDADAGVRAAAVFAAGVQGPAAAAVAAIGLKDISAMVQRRAAEAIVRMGQSPAGESLAPVADIYALLGSPDRFVRYAGRLALQRTPRAAWRDRVLADTHLARALDAMVAYAFTAPAPGDLEPLLDRQIALMGRSDLTVEQQIRLLRAFQLAAIEIQRFGPAPPLAPPRANRPAPPWAFQRATHVGADVGETRCKAIHTSLIGRFPAADERLTRELATVLAYCGQREATTKILAAFPKGDTNPKLQLHYLYVLRNRTLGWTSEQKTALVDVYARAAQWRGGASFPGFVNLLFEATIVGFTETEKQAAYEKVPQFAPLTEAELAQITANAARGGGNRGTPNAAVARSRGIRAISREEILDEQIFTPLRQPASAERGRPTYERACALCHRFGSIGQDFGPDLTTLASRFKKRDVVEAILWPSRAVSDQYQSVEIATKDGQSLFGLVAREDAEALHLQVTPAERPMPIVKALVTSRKASPVSLMPEGLVDDLSQGQLADLIAFLLAPPPQ
jgi:putative heme-binding domain-containing protein